MSTVEQAEGNGGDVSVLTNSLLMRQGSILARAQQGNGGAIFINRVSTEGQFIVDSQSIINADSEAGVNGEIDIESPDTDISSAVIVPTSTFAQSTALNDNPCATSSGANISSLTISHQPRLSQPPDVYSWPLLEPETRKPESVGCAR